MASLRSALEDAAKIALGEGGVVYIITKPGRGGTVHQIIRPSSLPEKAEEGWSHHLTVVGDKVPT
jgi:hypothetical protein